MDSQKIRQIIQDLEAIKQRTIPLGMGQYMTGNDYQQFELVITDLHNELDEMIELEQLVGVAMEEYEAYERRKVDSGGAS